MAENGKLGFRSRIYMKYIKEQNLEKTIVTSTEVLV